MRFVRLILYIAAPVLFFLIPTSYFESGRSICLFRNLFGHDCPGCGMTRAFSALVHGDFLAAVRYNAAVVIVFPLCAFVLAKTIAREVEGDTRTRETVRVPLLRRCFLLLCESVRIRK